MTNFYYACSPNRFYSTFTLETILAVAFGRVVDVQRGRADELKSTALKACDLKQDKMVMACIHLLSMSHDSSNYRPVNCWSVHSVVMPCLKKVVHWFLWRKHALLWKMMKDIAFQVVESRRDKQAKVYCYHNTHNMQ